MGKILQCFFAEETEERLPNFDGEDIDVISRYENEDYYDSIDPRSGFPLETLIQSLTPHEERGIWYVHRKDLPSLFQQRAARATSGNDYLTMILLCKACVLNNTLDAKYVFFVIAYQ